MRPGQPLPHDMEGVIKFAAEHQSSMLEERRYGEAESVLSSWRRVMYRAQLVGQDPARYDGAGYGNLSVRVGAPSAGHGRRAMLITATQTGGVERVGLGQYCVVERYDYRSGIVHSRGALMPSSESMTHGAIYDLSPSIRAVFHVHSPEIWQARDALRLPTTDAEVPYGTIEMAQEVQRLYRDTHLSVGLVFAMAGHLDGIVSFGRTPDEAGAALLSALAKAFAALAAV